ALAASPQVGLLTNFGKKPVAGAGHGPGRLPQKKVVGGRGTERTGSSAVGSVGESATAGTAGNTGNTGPAGSYLGGGGSSGSERSGATFGGLPLDGASGRGAGHGLDVRVDDRAGGALPAEQAGGELSGSESPGE